jgi:serine/threonine protein kinase
MTDSPAGLHSVGPYQLLGVIGTGTFATVYKAVHTVTNIEVALKTIPKRALHSMQEFELLQREVNLMKTMDHPFIASFFEVLDDADAFYLVIEYVSNGGLIDHINKSGGFDEPTARRVFCQLIYVLDYLHDTRRIVHRDLKAENVLFDESMNIRVVDFGFSRGFSSDNPFMQTTCGSPAYVAPEIIREESYTALADVWSAGVLLYAMVCGSLPFQGENLNALLQSILTATPVLPTQFSPELRALISKLLVKDPRSRIPVKAILEDPWLSDGSRVIGKDVIASLRVQDVISLDKSVLAEMRALGYDMTGLHQEVRTISINSRTAAYKMLRRKKIREEIEAMVQGIVPWKPEDVRSTGTLPMLDFPDARKRSDFTSLQRVPVRASRVVNAQKVRKRAALVERIVGGKA